MTFFLLAIAFGAQAAPTAPSPEAPSAVQAQASAARALKDVPGITITYHDLTEKDVKAIGKALKKGKPLTTEQQQLMAASTKWDASPSMTQITQNGSCTVTKAKIEFKAAVDMPRFNEAWIPAADLAAWRIFMSEVETQAAAKLWYPYDRLGSFERTVVGKPCAQAFKDGSAAMDQLKIDVAAFAGSAAVAPKPTPTN